MAVVGGDYEGFTILRNLKGIFIIWAFFLSLSLGIFSTENRRFIVRVIIILLREIKQQLRNMYLLFINICLEIIEIKQQLLK